MAKKYDSLFLLWSLLSSFPSTEQRIGSNAVAPRSHFSLQIHLTVLQKGSKTPRAHTPADVGVLYSYVAGMGWLPRDRGTQGLRLPARLSSARQGMCRRFYDHKTLPPVSLLLSQGIAPCLPLLSQGVAPLSLMVLQGMAPPSLLLSQGITPSLSFGITSNCPSLPVQRLGFTVRTPPHSPPNTKFHAFWLDPSSHFNRRAMHCKSCFTGFAPVCERPSASVQAEA